MPVQSSAQGILKLAMGKMHRNPGVPFAWLLQIHDEVMVEVADRDIAKWIDWARSVMESAVYISVPILAEAKVGKNWGDMVDLTKYHDGSII